MTNELYNRLTKVRTINRQIVMLKEKIELIESAMLPSAIRYDKDPVQTSPTDPMPGAIAIKIELEQVLYRKVDELAEEIVKLTALFSTLEDEREQMAMEYRYMHDMKWESIAEKMGYSTERIYQFNASAIKQLETLQ